MRVLILGLIIAFFDQLTKHIVRANFYLGESRVVIDGFFNLTYVRNTGAAWGMLRDQNIWLTILSLLILLILVVFRKSFLQEAWEHRIALGLMVGGIVGNLVDRVRLSWVTDFLDFYIGEYHWPAFNIADAAICTGVGIYILSSFWLAQHPGAKETTADSSEGKAG